MQCSILDGILEKEMDIRKKLVKSEENIKFSSLQYAKVVVLDLKNVLWERQMLTIG